MDIKKLKEEILFSGKIYNPSIKEIMDYQETRKALVNEYNNTSNDENGFKRRKELIKEMFASSGEGCYIEPPFHANFGGENVFLGSDIYVNFNLTLVDDGPIYIGDKTMIGPNVTIATASHPISPSLREKGLQYNLKVTIGRNVWLGANTVVLPGITIGDNSIIGAGSVVTKDIPSNVIAVGNPCKVLRSINKDDDIYYNHKKKIEII